MSTPAPPPVSRVREVPLDGFPALVHPEWAASMPWLVQGTTVRSDGPDDFDLGLFTEGGAHPEARSRWARLVEAMGARHVVHARQEHGTVVRIVEEGHVAGADDPLLLVEPCDGHATDRPGILLAIATADCVPVTVVDPERRAVAVLHAGWRGTAGGVLESGLSAMSAAFGTRPETVAVHLGPAICGDCYEVGPEVHHALGGPVPDGPEPVDLRAALARRARRAGVRPDRTTVSEHCTLCRNEHHFSHRGGDRGRQVTFVGVRSDVTIDPAVGLCSICRHHRITRNRRGSHFWMCELSAESPAFTRYPPLPVLRCSGFERADPDPWRAYADDESSA